MFDDPEGRTCAAMDGEGNPGAVVTCEGEERPARGGTELRTHLGIRSQTRDFNNERSVGAFEGERPCDRLSAGNGDIERLSHVLPHYAGLMMNQPTSTFAASPFCVPV